MISDTLNILKNGIIELVSTTRTTINVKYITRIILDEKQIHVDVLGHLHEPTLTIHCKGNEPARQIYESLLDEMQKYA